MLLIIAGRGCVFVAWPYKIKNCRTTSTEQCACIATDSDTLPITSRSKPRLPCDPITRTKVSEAHEDGSEQLLHATASVCVFPRALTPIHATHVTSDS